ncbi:MAG TPA: GGDEF domain-containing protein [Acetobacteraceae bacterium]|nr:GGDEF domain-containing protein [Acetobacteraceae bacterium]
MVESGNWRSVAAGAAELAFETDAAGRLVWVGPDPALGWSAATLLGQPARLLLAPAQDAAGFDPFAAAAAVRRRPVWLRSRGGPAVRLPMTVECLRDAGGTLCGVRGLAVASAAEADAAPAGGAGALRRAEVLDQMLARMRGHVLTPEMLVAMLDLLCTASGAEGAAILDTLREPGHSPVLHRAGGDEAGGDGAGGDGAGGKVGAEAVFGTVLPLLADASGQPHAVVAADGRPVLGCPSYTRFGERIGLVLWRAPGGERWAADDLQLASSVAALVRIVLEHAAIQRQMALQARTDLLTGLLSRRAFIEDSSKRIERLDREELPATLLFLDLDGFRAVNERFGVAAGDGVLLAVADLLRSTVRPTDLVARLGGDVFAVWLDGADRFTAAERAEALRLRLPERAADALPDAAVRPTASIGLAARRAGSGEEVESLLRRAALALHEVKRQGRAHWRVSLDEPL